MYHSYRCWQVCKRYFYALLCLYFETVFLISSLFSWLRMYAPQSICSSIFVSFSSSPSLGSFHLLFPLGFTFFDIIFLLQLKSISDKEDKVIPSCLRTIQLSLHVSWFLFFYFSTYNFFLPHELTCQKKKKKKENSFWVNIFQLLFGGPFINLVFLFNFYGAGFSTIVLSVGFLHLGKRHLFLLLQAIISCRSRCQMLQCCLIAESYSMTIARTRLKYGVHFR